MKMFPEVAGVYDLEAFAKSLPERSEFRKLRGLIRQVGAAGSAIEDIKECQEHVTLAKALDGDEARLRRADEEVNPLHLVGPLMSWSIILYCRATHTKSDTRNTDSIAAAFDADLLEKHKYLTGLRDNALAHFGPGPMGSRPWAKDVVVLRVGDDETINIYTPVVRQRHARKANEALQDLLPIALKVLRDLKKRRQEQFFSEFQRLFHEHWRVLRTLSGFIFDADTFFEHHPKAQALVEGMVNRTGPEGYLDDIRPAGLRTRVIRHRK